MLQRYPGSMRRSGNIWLFILNLLFGLYLLNSKLALVKFPESFSTQFNPWIILIAGGLLVLSAIILVLRPPRMMY